MSFASVKRSAQLITEDVGLPLLLVICVPALILLVRNIAREKRLTPLAAAGGTTLLATLVLFNQIPMKFHRYFAPVEVALLCSFVMWAIVGDLRRRRLLMVCAVAAVVWRTAVITDAVDYRPWLRGRRFSAPMMHLRDFLQTMNQLLPTNDERRALVYATDCLPEAEVLWGALEVRRVGNQPGMRQFGIEHDFEVAAPSFPNFTMEHLYRLPQADFVICAPPNPYPLPDDSTSADWKRVNDALWDSASAEKLGWREVRRTDRYALYQTADLFDARTNDRLLSARADFLTSLGLRSEEGLRMVGGMHALAALRGAEPAGRDLTVRPPQDEVCVLLVHTAYADNPLPERVSLAYSRDDTLILRARKEGEGDGTVVKVWTVQMAADGLEPVMIPMAHGEERDVAVADLLGQRAEPEGQLKVEILPGPAGDTTNDCVGVGLVAHGFEIAPKAAPPALGQVRVVTIAPPDRKRVIEEAEDGTRLILAHAEYAGNPLPHTVTLRCGQDDLLILRARKERQGDGTIIRLWSGPEAGEDAEAVEVSLGHGEDKNVPLQRLLRSQTQETGEITLRILPGPAGDATNDCVGVGLRPAR